MSNSTSTLEHLERLVGFPSIFTSERYTDISNYASEHLRSIGFRCHLLPDSTGTRAGLFAAIGPTGPGGILLSAHLDVVPVAGQQWTFDPFRLNSTR